MLALSTSTTHCPISKAGALICSVLVVRPSQRGPGGQSSAGGDKFERCQGLQQVTHDDVLCQLPLSVEDPCRPVIVRALRDRFISDRCSMLAPGQEISQPTAHDLALSFATTVCSKVGELVRVLTQVEKLFGQIQPVDVAVICRADRESTALLRTASQPQACALEGVVKLGVNEVTPFWRLPSSSGIRLLPSMRWAGIGKPSASRMVGTTSTPIDIADAVVFLVSSEVRVVRHSPLMVGCWTEGGSAPARPR